MKRELLTSASNPLLKRLISLRQARARKQSDWVRIDGARELLRALDAELPLEALVICPSRLRGDEARRALERAEATGLRARELTEGLYEQLRYGDRDEGICAAVRWSPLALEDLRWERPPLFLVLDGVEKPGNLGAVLRSADAAGADALILADSRLDARNPNVVRASMGTLFTQRVVRCAAEELRYWLVARGIVIACAIVGAETDYSDADLCQPLALILGPEDRGLDAAWSAAAQLRISLPMRGRADSLNLSVTAGILLYEAQRQRTLADGSTKIS